MNKMFSFIIVCALLMGSSGINAQGKAVKFYRVNSINTYLSDNMGKSALTLKYAKGGDVKPQYFIMSAPTVNEDLGYISARFLVNLKEDGKRASHLAFINGELYGDGTFILEGLDDDTPRSALFSFRLADKNDSEGSFLIESWVGDNGEGEWVKIENGVPCLVKSSVNVATQIADIFNIEGNVAERIGDNAPEAISPYSVTADYGAIIIKGAAGKNVVVTDIYGQRIAQKAFLSNEVSVSVPSGIAFVMIDNQQAVKVLVK